MEMDLRVNHAGDEVQAFSVKVDFFAPIGFKPTANGHLGDHASLDADVCQSGAVRKDGHGSGDEKVPTSCWHGNGLVHGVHEDVQRRRAAFGLKALHTSSFMSR